MGTPFTKSFCYWFVHMLLPISFKCFPATLLTKPIWWFHSNFSFLSTMASHPMNGCCHPIDKTFRFITRTYLIFIVGIGCVYTKLRLHLWYGQRNSNSVLTWWYRQSLHTAWVLMYSDVIMGAMASLITSLTIVNSTVYSGADKRKHQSSTSPVTGEWEFTGDRLIPCTNGQ